MKWEEKEARPWHEMTGFQKVRRHVRFSPTLGGHKMRSQSWKWHEPLHGRRKHEDMKGKGMKWNEGHCHKKGMSKLRQWHGQKVTGATSHSSAAPNRGTLTVTLREYTHSDDDLNGSEWNIHATMTKEIHKEIEERVAQNDPWLGHRRRYSPDNIQMVVILQEWNWEVTLLLCII